MRDLKELRDVALDLSKNKDFIRLIDDFLYESLNELVLTNSIREQGTQDEVIARQVFKRYFESLLDYDNIPENIKKDN